LDKDNNLFMSCVILTDVSHLELPDQVKLTIVNTKNNTCFSATSHHPHLSKEPIHLSKREVEILKLIIKGLTSHEIADVLFISYFTVRAHRKNILEKIGKKNTAEKISYAFHNGLF
jgi:DNA-binding NarL/FixJ family response regulator